jgi:antitoxin PrlF
VEISATVTSKGQITLPKPVREALGVHEGDRVVFRVLADRAVVARSPSLLDLAGSVSVPAEVRGTSWSDARRRARRKLDRR